MPDQKLRVLHVIGSLSVGGAERVLTRLCALTSDRCAHRILTILADPAEAHRLRDLGSAENSPLPPPSQRSGVVGAFSSLSRSCDVIHGWTYPGCVAAAMAHAARGRRGRLIWDVRSSLAIGAPRSRSSRILLRLSRALSAWPEVISFNSRTGCELHLAEGWAPRRHVVIPNPVPTPDPEHACRAARDFRDRMGLGPDTPVVALVARDAPVKRLDVAAEAIRLARARVPALECFHAGRTRPTGCAPGASWPFRCLGEVTDSASLISAADALLISSDVEGFPNVAAEAILLGTPVVTTRVGDAASIVGAFGEVCEPGDPAGLADALVRVLVSRLKRDVSVGGPERRRVGSMCDPKRIAEAYLALWTGSASSIGDGRPVPR